MEKYIYRREKQFLQSGILQKGKSKFKLVQGKVEHLGRGGTPTCTQGTQISEFQN